jgi:hypothetical protein
MWPELFPPVERVTSHASLKRDDASDAMTCVTQVLLGLRTSTNCKSSSPVERVRNLRPHKHTATSIKARPVGQDTASTRVQIVERLSRVTLSICWSDARTGLYADQRWRLGRARIRSFCVLTGAPIQVGDLIYRPKSNNSDSPSNRDFMILAATVGNEFDEHQVHCPGATTRA